LDLFQREIVRVDLFKVILHAFVNKLIFNKTRKENRILILYSRNPQEKTNDPVLIAAMIHCAKSVHDTLGFVNRLNLDRTIVLFLSEL
jgi:hypothetical protein